MMMGIHKEKKKDYSHDDDDDYLLAIVSSPAERDVCDSRGIFDELNKP